MDIKPRKLTDDEIALVMQLLYMDGEPMMIVNEDVMDIGRILKVKRVADGMTLKDLSKVLKLSPGTISEIETGKRVIPRGKEKVIRDYIYKTLYIFDRLEFRMVDDEEDDGSVTTH